MRASRRASLLAASALVASGLIVTTAYSPSAAAPGSGWCADDAPPCIVSATRNGSPVLESDPTWDVRITYPWTDLGGYEEFGWEVAGSGHALDDEWVVTLNTGTKEPETVKGRLGFPQVVKSTDGLSQWITEITANPVRWVTGCDSDAPWPWPCPATAASESIVLDGDIHRHPGEEFDWLNGFVFSASAPYNGIFLEEDATGGRFLVTEMVAPHFRPDGVTLFRGQARFRIPYHTLVEMGIPDPATLLPSSLSGTINGSATAGTFTVLHDPEGGGLIVDVTDITFSRKRIKVQAGTITPTRPRILKGTRVAPAKGRVTFTKAKPRGARVTGYQARCTTPGDTVRVNGRYPTIVVRGLQAGKVYKCQVRAKSKVGPGHWSLAKRLR